MLQEKNSCGYFLSRTIKRNPFMCPTARSVTLLYVMLSISCPASLLTLWTRIVVPDCRGTLEVSPVYKEYFPAPFFQLNVSWMEVQLLKKSLQIFRKCRHLKWISCANILEKSSDHNLDWMQTCEPIFRQMMSLAPLIQYFE